MTQYWPSEDIDMAARAVHKGGMILYPTDTIWGLGCDATNAQAVEKIYSLKKRGREKPLLVLVNSIAMLKDYIASIHPRVETLLSLHERPLTVVYPRAKNLPDNLVPEDGSIGIRVARDAFCEALIEACDCPLVSTSANISGDPFPKHFGEISSEVIKGVDYVCKYKRDDISDTQPSVVARYDAKGQLEFLRS